MWATLAAQNGNEAGIKLAKSNAKQLTIFQPKNAQNLASKHVRRNYKGC